MAKKATHDFHQFSKTDLQGLRTQLLTWYDKNKRTLPWRSEFSESGDDRGYAVLVSEMMLQQTRVATVIEYYTKWMKKWPTIQCLATATLEEVHAAWAGLGYYSRATRLLETAKVVMEKHGGCLPRTADQLVALPGIGKYTAGAVSSIAYGQNTSVVDGNVIRVLSRLRLIGGDSSSKPVVDHIWSLADAIVATNDVEDSCTLTQRPGDLNQAMMELGATVCTPTNANCAKCPLKNLCHAQNAVQTANLAEFPCLEECHLCLPPQFRSSLHSSSTGVATLPRKAPKKAARLATSIVCMVEFATDRGVSYLMYRRPPTGLLANLWEFPSFDDEEDDNGDENNDGDENRVGDQIKQTTGREKVTYHEAILTRLRERHPLERGSPAVPSHLYTFVQMAGDVVHKFSHIHQTYKIAHLRVLPVEKNNNDSGSGGHNAKGRNNKTADTPINDCPTFSQSDPRRVWMTEEELLSCGISTAMKKVFQRFIDASKGTNDKQNAAKKKRRGKESEVDGHSSKRQKSITAFFAK